MRVCPQVLDSIRQLHELCKHHTCGDLQNATPEVVADHADSFSEARPRSAHCRHMCPETAATAARQIQQRSERSCHKLLRKRISPWRCQGAAAETQPHPRAQTRCGHAWLLEACRGHLGVEGDPPGEVQLEAAAPLALQHKHCSAWAGAWAGAELQASSWAPWIKLSRS